MKGFMTVLVMAGLVAACSDTPTQPASAKFAPRLAAFTQDGVDPGHVRLFWPAADGMCTLWDTEDAILFAPCTSWYTPDASGVFGFTMKSDGKLTNSTGKAVVYGPTHYPPFLADVYLAWFGVTPRNGMLPLCDWDLSEYPDAYSTWDLSTLWCTTNWSYTISASGRASMHALFDKVHTYAPHP